jgi:hypothetical protein
MRMISMGEMGAAGTGLQRTFSQKRAYAALRTKKSTEAATKMRSFMTADDITGGSCRLIKDRGRGVKIALSRATRTAPAG